MKLDLRMFGKSIMSFSAETRSNGGYFSSLKNPKQWLVDALRGMGYNGKVSIKDALSFSGYYGAVKILAETMGIIPFNVYMRDESGKRKTIDVPAKRLLGTKPNSYMTSQFFHEMAMVAICNNGNAYSLIKRDADYNPIELITIDDPADVTIYYNKDYPTLKKDIFYKIAGIADYINPDDIFHLKNISFDGYKGSSLIEVARKYIYGGNAAQDYINEIYMSGGAEKVAIQLPGQIDSTGEERLRRDWSRKYGRLAGAKKEEIAILQAGMEIKTVGINPNDAELIESKKISIEDFSRYSRIPLHMLSALEKSGYNSLEHMSKEFVLYTMQPWFTRFEQEANAKLLREKDKGNMYCHYDSGYLTKGDTEAMANLVSKTFPTGALNADEIRELVFNKNPREGGDVYYTAVNVHSKEHEDAKINLANSKANTNG